VLDINTSNNLSVKTTRGKKQVITKIKEEIEKECFESYSARSITFNDPLGINNKVGYLVSDKNLKEIMVKEM